MALQSPARWPLGSLMGGISGGFMGLGDDLSQAGTNYSELYNTYNTNIQWTTDTSNILLGVPPQPTQTSPVIPTPEDEIAWLKRRVKEVLWQP